MDFGQLRLHEIVGMWGKCRELLAPAFRDRVNPYAVDDYYFPVKDGRAQLWAAVDGKEIVGAALTSVDTGSAMKICTIHQLGGDRFKEWVPLFDEAVTKFARDNGCAAIEAVTRKGFTRYFPDLEEDGTIYVRMLK